MRVAVAGSIATDHLMSFSGRFSQQLLPDQLHRLSVSFLVDRLDVRRGGVAGNICFGMGVLGEHPLLVAAVGADFDDYRGWLERHGVDTGSVLVSTAHHTARFVCTTDAEQNQIASFYPGAMSEARLIELAPIADRLGGLDLVLIGADDPDAMRRHTDECRERGYPFVADPSQQLAYMDGPAIRQLIEGAAYLFSNDYEKALIENKTGWSDADVLARVGTRVTTRGAAGALIERAGQTSLEVAAVAPTRIADPTGVGDAFRAGFLVGLSSGFGLERCAQVGSLLATFAIETVGTQEYEVKPARFRSRFVAAFGPEAASDLDLIAALADA